MDAAVIGLCSRSLIQRMANAAAAAEAHGENRLLERLDLPWPGYRDELATCLAAIVVSHKPDHGKQAALHYDTNYGWRDGPDKRGNPLVGRRKPIESIKNAVDAEAIASDLLREEIVQLLTQLVSSKDIRSALLSYATRTGVRRVICTERLAVIPIHDRRNGKPYRYVKGDGNYCYEIFRKPDGKWGGEVISSFEANQKEFIESPQQAQTGMSLVMRLHKDDVMAINLGKDCRFMRVAQFSAGKILLSEHHESNVADRARRGEFRFLQVGIGTLKKLRARIVGVDILGYVNDPQFRE